jgi:hypothetical protein
LRNGKARLEVREFLVKRAKAMRPEGKPGRRPAR